MPDKLTVKEWRLIKQITMQRLADAIGVHVNTIRSYEKDPKHIPIDKAMAIAKFYGVDINDIAFSVRSTT